MDYIPPPPGLTDPTIRILKLITGEEIIATVVMGTGFDGDRTYISAPVVVERGGLGSRWITGLNVNTEPANQPIPNNAVLGIVQEEDIQPNLLQKYKERVGLAPRTERRGGIGRFA